MAPSDERLLGFFNERIAVPARLRRALQAQLSADDWAAVRRFIRTEIVPKLKVGRLIDGKPK